MDRDISGMKLLGIAAENGNAALRIPDMAGRGLLRKQLVLADSGGASSTT
jgi:hypothetical protein